VYILDRRPPGQIKNSSALTWLKTDLFESVSAKLRKK
jgi:hypothetical protein